MTKYVGDDILAIPPEGQLVAEAYPEFTVLADGSSILSWRKLLQRFDENGEAIGGTVPIEAGADSAARASGGWVSAYTETISQSPDTEVYLTIYDGQGLATASDIHVNTFSEYKQTLNDIAVLADGGWVISWQGYGADDHGDGDDEIYMQRYDAGGTAVGSNTRVNTNVERDEVESRVVGLEDGGWIVSWTGMTGYYTDARVHMQRYDENGNMVGPEQQVHDDDKGSMALSAVAALPDGGWLVASTAVDPVLGTKSLLARFNASGEKISETETGRRPKVAVFDDGGFVVVHYRIADGGKGEYDQTELFAQVYNADGSLDGREYLVDRKDYLSPGPNFDIDVIGNHDFIISWSHAEIGNVSPVEQKRYSPGLNEAPIAVDDTATMLEGKTLTVDVLANDYDPEGDNRLTLESATLVSGNAAVSVTEDGEILILDKSSGIGSGSQTTLTIEYQVSDGFDFVTGTLDVTVEGVTDRGDHVYGTENSDVMRGVKFGEIFHGKGGGDIIRGENGNDVLFGDAGNDLLEGDNGRDVLVGGRGNDLMRGGSGRDTYIIAKGDGRDRILVDSAPNVIDLSDFNFESVDELDKLVKVKGYDVVIDLPGQDWLFLKNGALHGAFYSVDVII
jgi:hypothetical protein